MKSLAGPILGLFQVPHTPHPISKIKCSFVSRRSYLFTSVRRQDGGVGLVEAESVGMGVRFILSRKGRNSWGLRLTLNHSQPRGGSLFPPGSSGTGDTPLPGVPELVCARPM